MQRFLVIFAVVAVLYIAWFYNMVDWANVREPGLMKAALWCFGTGAMLVGVLAYKEVRRQR